MIAAYYLGNVWDEEDHFRCNPHNLTPPRMARVNSSRVMGTVSMPRVRNTFDVWHAFMREQAELQSGLRFPERSWSH